MHVQGSFPAAARLCRGLGCASRRRCQAELASLSPLWLTGMWPPACVEDMTAAFGLSLRLRMTSCSRAPPHHPLPASLPQPLAAAPHSHGGKQYRQACELCSLASFGRPPANAFPPSACRTELGPIPTPHPVDAEGAAAVSSLVNKDLLLKTKEGCPPPKACKPPYLGCWGTRGESTWGAARQTLLAVFPSLTDAQHCIK